MAYRRNALRNPLRVYFEEQIKEVNTGVLSYMAFLKKRITVSDLYVAI